MELLNTHPIKKSDLGFHGNLFGGKMLAWIDAAAAVMRCSYVIPQEWSQYQLINVFLRNRQKKVHWLKSMGFHTKSGQHQ